MQHVSFFAMESIPLHHQCSNHSIGPANELFSLLIQTLLTAQCSISPPDIWPKDYGPSLLEKGIYIK